MGQYFYIVNLDKKEYLHPHKMGSGLKLWEICASNLPRVLPLLLRQSSEGGGGDYHGENTDIVGRWAGDRITVVGDYDESKLYNEAKESYKEISNLVRPVFDEFIEIEDHKLSEPWDK
jgi:hypothetical protein